MVVRRKALLAPPSPKSTSWWLRLEKEGTFAEVSERRLSIGQREMFMREPSSVSTLFILLQLLQENSTILQPLVA